jgi:O-antigen/teichoic acid export membrane protein
VVATTVMRIAPLWIYRRNAYKVFPDLCVRRDLVRRERLRELTGFSIYIAVVDWSTRLTYATDAFYLAAFIDTTAVGVYAVAQRVSETLFNLTYQLHTFLLPVVVHRAVDGDAERQRSMMVRATRFQLAIAVCLCGSVAAVADVLLRRWIGPSAEGAIVATRLLCLVVVMRAWAAMPGTVLQGTNRPRFVAVAAALSAAVNLVLSVPLVIRWGLPGVASGTLIAAVLFALAVFPRACHAVGLSVWAGYRAVVWPAVWPGVIIATLLATTRSVIPDGLMPLLAHLAAGGAGYLLLFVAAGLEVEERQWLLAALQRVLRRDTHRLATSDVVGS